MITTKMMQTEEFKQGFAAKFGTRSPYRVNSYQDNLWMAGYQEAFLTGSQQV